MLEDAINQNKDIQNHENVIDILKMHHDVRLILDNSMYWTTMLVLLDDNHFFMYHDYYDSIYDWNSCIVEGLVENEVIKFARVHFNDRGEITSSIGLDYKVKNRIPFQNIMRSYGLDHRFRRPQFDYTYESGKKWTDVMSVNNWFVDCIHDETIREHVGEELAYALANANANVN